MPAATPVPPASPAVAPSQSEVLALPAPEPRPALPPPKRPDTKQSWAGLIVSDVAPPEGLIAYRVFGGGSLTGGKWMSLTRPTSAAAKFSMFSANSCASTVQTLVNDLE